MRPDFANDVVRPASPVGRRGLKTIEFDAWRQLDSSAPSTPQTSNPSIVRARSIGPGATAAQYKALFHLQKPTTFKSASPDNERFLSLSSFGYGQTIFTIDNPNLSDFSQGILYQLSVKAVLDDFDPDLATWSNKVTSPDVTYDTAQTPLGSGSLPAFEIPTDYSTSDVIALSNGSIKLPFGPTNIWSATPFGKYIKNADMTVYGFLVDILGATVGSVYGGGTQLTNWWCTLQMSIGSYGRLHGPRIDW